MEFKPNQGTGSGPMKATGSRRHEVRFAPPAALRCALAGSKDRILVRDIGVGGLAILSSRPFDSSRLQEFTLSLGPLTVVRRARLAHGRKQDDGRWIYGFQFVNGQARGEQARGASIEELIDLITGSSIEFS